MLPTSNTPKATPFDHPANREDTDTAEHRMQRLVNALARKCARDFYRADDTKHQAAWGPDNLPWAREE
jgi:hypothetical protein